MNAHYIMDYETLSNCFTAVFKNYKTNEFKEYVIHDLRNDFKEFLEFLNENIKHRQKHISFNGLAFDSQITEHILKNKHFWYDLPGCMIANNIYTYAQFCIMRSDNNEFQDYPEWKLSIKQIDLYKMNHWDNPAKRSSLKWIQYSMDWDNLLDMPIHHSTEIKTLDEINLILEYNRNDVNSTHAIYIKNIPELKLRKTLAENHNIETLYSSSETKISKEIFAYHLSNKLNLKPSEIKKLKTYRDKIVVSDLILPYIKFNSSEFKKLYDTFKNLVLNGKQLKGAFKYTLRYKDVVTTFGLGGVHGARKAGIYESNEDYVIITSDVVSFYPNLSIKNKWSPGHFPNKVFCDQYEWFFNERVKIPKKDPMNYVYKIILNSTYGLSNEENSFFYDPELTMRITINGQLSLMMLYEMIMEQIPEAKALMQNTDGLETIIPKSKLDLYYQICSQWEEITDLKLEHDFYKKMIIADVNSYIALYDFKTVDLTTWRETQKENPHYVYKVENSTFMYAPAKTKGRLDFHNLALHKNKSKLVIPKAIYNYFIFNILPQEYLKNNRNILDYCLGSKTNKGWQQVARSIENGKFKEQKLQKINRYYVSNKGVKLLKINVNDRREIQLEAGKWLQTIYNKIELKSWDKYNVNTNYYLSAIESEIEKILDTSSNQLKLF